MFTDEDLKRLKDYLSRNNEYIATTSIRAFVERLDAAEKVLNRTGTFWPIELDDDVQAWRKAAGRD